MLKPLSPEAVAFLEEQETKALLAVLHELVIESPMMSAQFLALCFDPRFKGSDSGDFFDGITQVLKTRVIGSESPAPDGREKEAMSD